MATKVHVAIYDKPMPVDAAHWALWLEGPGKKDFILQVLNGIAVVPYCQFV